jgi:hypothetical protein
VAGDRIYEGSDSYVSAFLRKRDVSGNWVPDAAAQSVVLEVFDPDGVSIGSKNLTSGVSYVGNVTVDGEEWAKYRAQFHFANPGIYEAHARITGQGGGQISSRDAIPVENL